MQRINKSGHSPVGTAFFLVLGLAILPFSLKFAGVQVSFNPQLSGATDAWQQISEVFAASYHTGLPADLSVNREQPTDRQQGSEECTDSATQSACNGQVEEEFDTISDISKPQTPNATCSTRTAKTHAKRVAASGPPVAAIVVAGTVMQHLALNAVNALNFAADQRIPRFKAREVQRKTEFLNNIEMELFKNGIPGLTSTKNVTVPKNLKVQVRFKKPATATGETAAQCKVFSALSLERRRQCDRASLMSLPVVTTDTSEF